MQGKNNIKISFKIAASLLNVAAVTAALLYLENNDDVELSTHSYHNDLIDRFNDTSIPQELRESLRNPLDLGIIPPSEIVNSITHDNRRPVSMGNFYYNMTGRISNRFDKIGTGFIVQNPHDPENIYVSTAGHVITNEFGTIDNPRGISFTANYISNGQISVFSSQAEAMVVDYVGNSQGPDKAMIRLEAVELPPEIMPGTVLTDYNGLPLESLEVAGYSADLMGLSVDDNCSIIKLYEHSFSTNCDISMGASGGPVTVGVNNQAYIIGSNTSIQKDRKLAYHDILTSELLVKASAMRDGSTQNLSHFLGCRAVTADILNVRQSPSTDSEIMRRLHKDRVVIVMSNEEEWVGILITHPKREVFYIHKDHTRMAPC